MTDAYKSYLSIWQNRGSGPDLKRPRHIILTSPMFPPIETRKCHYMPLRSQRSIIISWSQFFFCHCISHLRHLSLLVASASPTQSSSDFQRTDKGRFLQLVKFLFSACDDGKLEEVTRHIGIVKHLCTHPCAEASDRYKKKTTYSYFISIII